MLQLSPQHGNSIPGILHSRFLIPLVMFPHFLQSHLANIVRTLSAFCHLIQDFSGRSFHYMGVREE